MKKYQQLTLEERYQIYVLLKAGQLPADIARLIGRDKATISRELKRNRSGCDYGPQFAQRRAGERKASKAKPRITQSIWVEVEERLSQQWSPEQIAGRRAREGQPGPSHEWIYQRIYRDKAAGGRLYLNLRGSPRYRERYGRYDKRRSPAQQI